MRTGALLLIGIGSALVIATVLAVLIVPSGYRRQPASLTPRGPRSPRFNIPLASPAGSLLKGFSYLYAPLMYPRAHYSVGQALQPMVELVGPTESPVEGGEPVVDLLDQPRSEEL